VDVSGSSNTAELKDKLARIMLRRTKEQVLPELPPLIRSILPVDISSEQQRDYSLALHDLKAWLRVNGKSNRITTLTKLNYLRQIVGMGKVKSAIELAEDVLQSTSGKLVMYAHHKVVVNALKEGLKEYGVDTIVGEDDNRKRMDTMIRFQNTQLPRVLVISSAGGEGIDLNAADNLIMVERAWNPGKEEQIEGRLHRIGQENKVAVWYLVARGTIDEKVHALVESKRYLVGELVGTPDIETIVLDELMKG